MNLFASLQNINQKYNSYIGNWYNRLSLNLSVSIKNIYKLSQTTGFGTKLKICSNMNRMVSFDSQ